MADIELVIKIPEEMYKNIQIRDWRKDDRKWFSEEWRAIRNGTPLPKGHGALKDASELLNMTKGYKSELGRLKADPFVKCGIETVENFINDLPSIIEADTESEE